MFAASLETQPLNDNFDHIRRKLRGMARLIDQLLTLSELSSKRIRADGSVSMRGSADAIVVALRNLISNAVRHSEKGGAVTLTVDRSGPWVEVADTGPGIPLAERDAVFQPFWRGSRSGSA